MPGTLRVVFRNRQIGRRYRVRMEELSRRNRRALVGAAQDALDEMIARGRADIAGAGNFGSRWTRGLSGRVRDLGGDVTIELTHDVPYFPVHQEGRVIRGRPLLWIPLSFAREARGKSASEYPGRLFRVDRKNGKAPLLLSVADKQPKYSGHESVRIPKRFHVLEIARDVARRIREFFQRRVGGER